MRNPPVDRPLKAIVPAVAFFVLCVAFISLFFFLDIKPPQHDEGVNGWIIEDVTANGFYAYNPAGYHGPLHFYILFLFKSFLGRNIWALRLPAVMFAMATIWLFLRMAPYVGRFTAMTLAFLAAASPGTIFYSRYAIHESTLFFFSVLTILGCLRFFARRDRVSIWQLGMGLTGMILIKETYILSVGSFVLAYAVARVYERFSPSPDAPRRLPRRLPRRFQIRDVVWVSLTGIFLIVAFYSSFFMKWEGLTGLFRAYWDWFVIGASKQSEQKGHWKYFFYWLELFSVYEWAALLGVFLTYRLLGPARFWDRVLGLYALGLLLIYSMISYKTPWCILQLIWPFLFVTASALQDLSLQGPKRFWLAVLIVVALGTAALQRSIELNFFRYTDEKEPYVHVQTYPDIMEIQSMLDKLVRKDPMRLHMRILVVKKAYWPMSWLMARFTKADFYPESLPPIRDAALIFVDWNRRIAMETKMRRAYFIKEFRLNAAQKPTVAYFDKKIFKDFFDPSAPSFEPQPVLEAEDGQGLVARYFENSNWDGPSVKTERIATVDFSRSLKERGPAVKPFSVILEGEIFIPVSAAIKFYLASDDGSELFIDGERIIDNSGDHPEKVVEAARQLKKGWHSLRIRYYDIGGNAACRLWWRLPGKNPERIAPRYFRPLRKT